MESCWFLTSKPRWLPLRSTRIKKPLFSAIYLVENSWWHWIPFIATTTWKLWIRWATQIEFNPVVLLHTAKKGFHLRIYYTIMINQLNLLRVYQMPSNSHIFNKVRIFSLPVLIVLLGNNVTFQYNLFNLHNRQIV